MVEDDNIPSSYCNSVEDVNQQLLQASEQVALQRIKRDQHWHRMRQAGEYWHSLTPAGEYCTTPDTYHTWLEKQWGLKVVLDGNSMITSDYTVVDEAKYLLYLLKFGLP